VLVFDDDNFNEDETFLLTDWLAHTPTEVLAKNFGVPESAFANIPSEELYIFKSEVPGPENPSNLSVVISESPASPG
jgi:oxalate decarboxylase